jgi:regulator of protease activity HflC (stomatin/prohibitin superfamily)
MSREIIIKDTHRALWYEDGVLVRVLEAGRHAVPRAIDLGFWRRKKVEVVLVDVRERDLTIKGQEILTADKVALRVSVIVQFRVVDARAAVHEVESFEDRLYTDVQLAARRTLAILTLEEILTNRGKLSEEILSEVKEAASSYGVAILRADVKDLVFPGDLQAVMNRVLAAERTSQAQLIEARTRAEAQRIDSEARASAQRTAAEAEAEAQRIRTAAEVRALHEREQAAQAYASHPALLRLSELETLRELAKTANARLYVGFDRDARRAAEKDD